MPYDPRFPLVVCPVCESTTFGKLSESPPAFRCDECGLGIEASVSSNPVGDYASEAYDAARNGGTGSDRFARFHHDCAVAVHRMRQMKDPLAAVPDAARLWLDVGANNGAVLAVARRRGWEVRAVEADPRACADLTTLFGIPAVTYGLWCAEGGPDAGVVRPGVVSFFDTLEHMLDPTAALSVASADLEVGGLLIIEAPDLDSAKNFDNWKHRRVRPDFTEHQYHFNEKSLEIAVARYCLSMSLVHVARPVVGKIQMVWRKDEPPAPPAPTDDSGGAAARAAQTLLCLSEVERNLAWKALADKDPSFAAAVKDELARVKSTTEGH